MYWSVHDYEPEARGVTEIYAADVLDKRLEMALEVVRQEYSTVQKK